MPRKQVNWPSLLRDGGWREVRPRAVYWPKYLRVHRGEKQVLSLNCSVWVFESGGVVMGAGTLDECLTAADKLAVRRVKV